MSTPVLRDARTSAFWRFVAERPGPLLPMWNERLVQLRPSSGGSLRTVERLQLDPKNALFVVEVSGKERFLVGAGDKGVQLLTALPTTPTVGGPAFQGELDKVAAASEGEVRS